MGVRPTIGVVIATPGRKSLLRTLNSIMYQGLIEGDDVLVVADGHHEPTQQLIETLGPPFRYAATQRTRDWGHSQQNWGLKQVGGDWLLLQDDDDVFLPRAFDEARTIISKLESPRPVIGRVMTPYLGILWTAPGKEPLDGHCLLVPNDKAKLGYFGTMYEGDQTWLASNLKHYETYSWADRVWSLTRPTQKLWPQLVLVPETGVWQWIFMAPDGDTWSNNGVATLTMWRDEEHDHWYAKIHFNGITYAEACEVVEFAAWAGQGSDVWFQTQVTQHVIIEALTYVGYQPHVINNETNFAEYTFTWPPHRFVPPEETKEEKA